MPNNPTLEMEKYVDKMDAEIMDWFYECIEINFGATMVQDSSELREILKENISHLISEATARGREEAIQQIKIDAIWVTLDLDKTITKAKELLGKLSDREISALSFGAQQFREQFLSALTTPHHEKE